MTEDLPLDQLVRLMQRHNVKRLPVVRGEALVGIVTRTDLLRAVASLARDVPDPTADDDHIRKPRILIHSEVRMAADASRRYGPGWHCASERMITDERYRQAAIVAAENVPA